VFPPLTVKHTGSTDFPFRPILHRISPYPHQLTRNFTPPSLPHHIDSRIRLRHTNSHHFTPFHTVSHHTHTQTFSHLGAAVPQTVEHIYWVLFPLSNVYPSARAHTNPHTISHHPTPLKPPDLFTAQSSHTTCTVGINPVFTTLTVEHTAWFQLDRFPIRTSAPPHLTPPHTTSHHLTPLRTTQFARFGRPTPHAPRQSIPFSLL
jgi:hypothetical protein